MGQALYRKYRPKKLEDIIGQEHITATLQNALKSGKLSHAYLFTGPRGVGKTSVARILAHAVNDESYTDESSHLDIIEIDAASNRRIDEIRELIERVRTLPATARYKVYIIDEVHMLTREAFNALLKTLEEPPAHVLFILATTEAHKLPATIISRTQRFTFRPIEPAEMAKQLSKVAKAEKIKVDDEALKLIAEHGEGSFRDSLSLLDQVRSHADSVTGETVRELIGEAPAELLSSLENALSVQNAEQVVTLLDQLDEQGYESALVARQLAGRLRQQLLEGQPVLPKSELIELLRQLIDIPASREPQISLELALLGSIKSSVKVEVPTKTKQLAAAEAATPSQVSQPPEEASQNKQSRDLDDSLWTDLLAAIKDQHNTLYSVLRMAKPSWQEDELKLSFGFAFHQKRVNEPKNLKIIADTVKDLSGQAVTVSAKFDKSQPTDASIMIEDLDEPDPALASISNIFGGAEQVEL